MTVGQPDAMVFGDEPDRYRFSWTHQHRVPGKGLHRRCAVSFQNPEKYAVDVHGMQPGAAVYEGNFVAFSYFYIGIVRRRPEFQIHGPADAESPAPDGIQIPCLDHFDIIEYRCGNKLFCRRGGEHWGFSWGVLGDGKACQYGRIL